MRYRSEIGWAQVRHRPRSRTHETIGTLSRLVRVVEQKEQCGRGETSDSWPGTRWMTAFRSDPTATPAIPHSTARAAVMLAALRCPQRQPCAYPTAPRREHADPAAEGWATVWTTTGALSRLVVSSVMALGTRFRDCSHQLRYPPGGYHAGGAGLEAVADAPDGDDPARAVGLAFDLAPKPVHVFGDGRFVLPVTGGGPDVLQKLLAGKHLTG